MVDLRIQNINSELMKKFKNIAKDKCETTTHFVRPIIREILDSYNDVVIFDDEKSELLISGFSEELMKKLSRLSKKIGVTEDQLLRVKLYEYLESQPNFIKKMY